MEETIRGLWLLDLDASAQTLHPFDQLVRNGSDFFHAMSDREIVGLILLINLAIALIYLIVQLARRRWKKGLLLSVFMLAAPVVGFMYLLLAELLHVLAKPFGDRDVSTKELSFDQTRARQILEADTEKGRDLVPMEEALIISGKHNKRNTFMEMIKGDEVESLGVVREAVENEDTEIAHYAASYMSDMYARVKQQEAALRKAFEEKPTPEACYEYVNQVRNAVNMELFDGVEQRKFLERLDKAYLWQMEHAPKSPAIEDMTSMARCWMKLNDMDQAKRWIDRILPHCYDDLGAFKICATYYFHCHDSEKLLELLTKVRSSKLELDNEALEWLRFFDPSNQKPSASGGQMG